MYKVIYQCMPALYPEETVFGILSNRFSSKVDAIRFILNTEIPRAKREKIGDNDEIAEASTFEVVEQGNDILFYEYLCNELDYTTTYRVVDI